MRLKHTTIFMEKLSNNLVFYKKSSDYIVYHKLFGNLSLLNQKAFNLLINYEEDSTYIDEDYKVAVNKFKDNYFLVNQFEEHQVVLDEIKMRESASGNILIGLQLVVSNFCNFTCNYCFLDEKHKLRDNYEHNEPNNMNFETAKLAIEHLIENVKNYGYNAVSIEFFGGEPLMNWLLMKQIMDYYGSDSSLGIKIYYSVTTNGSLITDEMIEYFKKYEVIVIISFDSPTNRERVQKDGTSLIEVLTPILVKLKEKGIILSFNSVISKWTLNHYSAKKLVDFAQEYNVRNIALILDLDGYILTDKYNADYIIDLLWEVFNYAKQFEINVTGYWEKIYAQIKNSDTTYFEKGYKTCPATGCKISVEPSGDVFACKCCTQKIGVISKFQDILNDQKYKNYVNKIYKNGEACADCELVNFCSGLCVGALEKKGSMYGNHELLCEIYRKINEKLILNTARKDYVDIIEL